MFRKTYIYIVLLLGLFLLLSTSPAKGVSELTVILPAVPQPSASTVIQLQEASYTLDLYEETTIIQGTYSLFNTSEEKTQLTLQLPANSVYYSDKILSNDLYQNDDTYLSLTLGDENVPCLYNKKNNTFQWDITLETKEEKVLSFKYVAPNSPSDNNLVYSGISWPTENLWADEPSSTSLSANFQEINPGLIQEISPQSYKLVNNSLSWSWKGFPDSTEIYLAADIFSEKETWEQSFSEQERERLIQFLDNNYYLSAAFFFENKYKNSDISKKYPLRTGQAYYLERAGKHAEALRIWKELYDDEFFSSYVFWYLGREYELQTSKLSGLYKQASEIQIHPLLQRWLGNQLPSFLVEQSPPEVISASANVDNDQDGLIISGTFSDKDGDIRNITLRYNCHENACREEIFSINPLSYSHTVSLFVPMNKSMQKLQYEFVINDSNNYTISTDIKEAFYLTNEIQSHTYPLQGAKLVLGNYSYIEHDKVYKWFKSYLKMAAEANFVPLKGKDPYFIFLGEYHELINTYEGPLFLLYTPAPFNPDETKLHVHKYMLSYWYGPGWEILSSEWLQKLGDGLLLGQGPLVQVLNYLKHEDTALFYELLNYVGQGNDWEKSLHDIYNMSALEINLRAQWYAYGNNILAVLIIVIFAWLGKNGIIAKVIRKLK